MFRTLPLVIALATLTACTALTPTTLDETVGLTTDEVGVVVTRVSVTKGATRVDHCRVEVSDGEGATATPPTPEEVKQYCP